MKPILFNTEMVRALLEGRKTVTRRVVKPQPEARPTPVLPGSCWPGYFAVEGTPKVVRPPYNPSDILWVRETWQAVYETEWNNDEPYKGQNIRELIPNFDSIPKVEAGLSQECSSMAMRPRMKYFVFKASDIEYADNENGLVWRPSIHMPREAARIFLRVTDVRVERLQEISYTELLAEGVIPLGHLPGGCKCSAYTDGCMDGPCVNRDNYEFWRYATPFIKLWDRTVKPADRDTSGWDADPWVWVIEFERISKDEALGGGGDD